MKNRIPRIKLAKATTLSAIIRIFLRLNLSIQTPATKPITACGNKPTTLATVKAIADLVSSVIHQMIENCTLLEPTKEKAWPIEIITKDFFHL